MNNFRKTGLFEVLFGDRTDVQVQLVELGLVNL